MKFRGRGEDFDDSEVDLPLVETEDDVYFCVLVMAGGEILCYLTSKTEWEANGCCPQEWYDWCPKGWWEVGEHTYSPTMENRHLSLRFLTVDLIHQGYIPHSGFAEFMSDIESDNGDIGIIYPNVIK